MDEIKESLSKVSKHPWGSRSMGVSSVDTRVFQADCGEITIGIMRGFKTSDKNFIVNAPRYVEWLLKQCEKNTINAVGATSYPEGSVFFEEATNLLWVVSTDGLVCFDRDHKEPTGILTILQKGKT